MNLTKLREKLCAVPHCYEVKFFNEDLSNDRFFDVDEIEIDHYEQVCWLIQKPPKSIMPSRLYLTKDKDGKLIESDSEDATEYISIGTVKEHKERLREAREEIRKSKEESSERIRKISEGYVIQEFSEKGDLIKQEFRAEGEVDFEDENGVPLEVNKNLMKLYHPFNMVP